MRGRSILVFLLLLAGSVVRAQVNSVSFRFLDLTPSPRVGALGGHVLAHNEQDLNLAIWAPALLRPEVAGQVVLNAASHPAGTGFGDAHYAFKAHEGGTVAIGMKYINYGTQDQTDALGQVTGQFQAADYLLSGTYGYVLDSNWSVGGQFKLANSTIETYSSWAVATDLQAAFHLPKSRFTASVMLRNIGFQLSTYGQEREPLPFEVQAGISNRFEHLPFRWHVAFVDLQQLNTTFDRTSNALNPITGQPDVDEATVLAKVFSHVTVGGELMPFKGKVALRLSYNFRRAREMQLTTRNSAAGLSLGFGIKIKRFRLDYGRVNYSIAGGANHFGVSTNLHDWF